jgi:hypothetical protein
MDLQEGVIVEVRKNLAYLGLKVLFRLRDTTGRR